VSDSSTIQPAEPAPATNNVTGDKDLTGRSRLVSNVLFTWGGQMVFFVSGFIMPRMIDRALGKEVLGVWDFSWSLVAYFRFVDMGVTASVNR
jgi:O-antigen/teichoic acid export membrane protein